MAAWEDVLQRTSLYWKCALAPYNKFSTHGFGENILRSILSRMISTITSNLKFLTTLSKELRRASLEHIQIQNLEEAANLWVRNNFLDLDFGNYRFQLCPIRKMESPLIWSFGRYCSCRCICIARDSPPIEMGFRVFCLNEQCTGFTKLPRSYHAATSTHYFWPCTADFVQIYGFPKKEFGLLHLVRSDLEDSQLHACHIYFSTNLLPACG